MLNSYQNYSLQAKSRYTSSRLTLLGTLGDHKGYTLIEIISTLVIIGILAMMVSTRAGTFISTNSLIIEAERLNNHLRYVQMMSMNSKESEVWRLKFNGDTSFTIYQYDDTLSDWESRNLAGSEDSTYSFSDGVKATTSPTVIYNSWGAPVQTDRSSLVTSDITITLSQGSDSKSLTVTKNTGYAYLQ